MNFYITCKEVDLLFKLFLSDDIRKTKESNLCCVDYAN